MKYFNAILLLLAITWPAARAAELTAPIEPYLDEKTVMVARLDLDRLDAQAATQWWESATKNAGADAAPLHDSSAEHTLKAASGWIESVRKAGGRTLFAVVTLGDSPGGQAFFMTPIENGANAKDLMQSFEQLGPSGMKTAQINQAVFMADPSVLAQLKSFKPSPRPELAVAFADAGDAPIRAALIVSEDVRRVVEALAGKLPRDFGGGPITVLTNGVHWASLAIKPPPEPSMALHVQAKDADSARAFSGLIRLALLITRQHQNENEEQISMLMNDVLTPQVENDRVSIAIDSQKMTTLAKKVPSSWRAAGVEVMMSNIRQLLLACIMYSNEHKDQFPPTLEEAVKWADVPPSMLTNPRDPARKPAYVYLKPTSAKDIKDGGRQVLIYEAHDPSAQRIAVGFADGHVETVANDAVLQQLLAEPANRPGGK